jgi:cytochrome P450
LVVTSGGPSAIAEAITLQALSDDPYPFYAALRHQAPVAWIPALGMWMVTRYADVRELLLDSETFVTGTEASLIHQTFGEQMLACEGKRHSRLRQPWLNGAFMPVGLGEALRVSLDTRIAQLLDPIVPQGRVEFRQAFAARLPVLVMLDLFGLPARAETQVRDWYDRFELALSSHVGQVDIRRATDEALQGFHALVQTQIDACREGCGRESLLQAFVDQPAETRLADDEIHRNALIMFFGGISTVEAVILNMLWALLRHPPAMRRALDDRGLLDAAFDETMRWIAPAQSATRHTTRSCQIAGVTIPAGATVNGMLGSANRDEAIFEAPDVFYLDRPNARQRLGFAAGPHFCLCRHLARAGALAALNGLLDRTKSLRLAAPVSHPRGHEFRQPPMLWLAWD